MQRERDSRTLMVVSLVVAFVLGTGFGLFGSRLRPRVALAPGPVPEPKPVAAEVPPSPVRASSATEPAGADDLDSVPGNGTAVAPEGYPIKGNRRSGIYHVPGGFSYDRTVATVHFRTAEAAEAAGFRASRA